MRGGEGRVATWRERENNKRRERRRRAIAARIFAGLRAHGSCAALAGSHADNNELLKALCRQAGWTVLDDGTTFRTTHGCIPPPPPERIAATAPASTTMSPSSSSSFPSPTRPENLNPNPSSTVNPSFLLPFLRNLSSLPPLRFSTSAPATPPLSSPAPAAEAEAEARPPKLQRLDSDAAAFLRRGAPISFASAPASPTRRRRPRGGGPNESDAPTVDFGLWGGAVSTAPASPTFNLVHTAPAGAAAVGVGELERGEGRVVKPWEGEKIHEVGVDELELTLGVGRNGGGGGGVKF